MRGEAGPRVRGQGWKVWPGWARWPEEGVSSHRTHCGRAAEVSDPCWAAE